VRSHSLLVVLASFLLSAANGAPAQTAPQLAGAVNSGYILRVEHIQNERDFCFLIRPDGQYHWELHLPDKAKVYEGTLDQVASADLIKILDADEFRQLKQEKIVPPFVSTGIDRLAVLVARPEGAQHFEFFDKTSREPLRAAIDPLLGWLDWLRKQPHKELSEEEGRNNCLPPKNIALKKRPPTGAVPPISTPAMPPSKTAPEAKPVSQPPVTPAVQSPYLMRMLVDELYGGVFKRECLVVYSGGRYRMERGRQKPGERRVSEVFQDSLTPEALQQLQEILDDPALRNAPAPEENVRRYIEGHFTTLWLPGRDGGQRLQFKRYESFGVRSSSHISHDNTMPLKPLHQWLKSTVEGKKRPEAVQDAVPNDCAPGH
jgi:hypothetical protein